MSSPAAGQRPGEPLSRAEGIRFVVIFSLLYLALLWLWWSATTGARDLASKLACAAAGAVAGVFGLESDSSGNVLTVAGSSVRILFPCAVPRLHLAYFAAIVAYPRRPTRDKAAGVLLGAAFFAALNALRFITLALVGNCGSPQVFDAVHRHVFPILLATATFVAWLVWERQGLRNRSLLAFVALSATLTGAFSVLLTPLVAPYLAFLARLVNPLLAATGSSVTLVANTLFLAFQSPSGLLVLPLNVLFSAVFFGLIGASLLRGNRVQLLRPAVAGMVALPLLHAACAAALGLLPLAGDTARDALLPPALWLVRFVSAGMPVLLWFLVQRAGAPRPDPSKGAPAGPNGPGGFREGWPCPLVVVHADRRPDRRRSRPVPPPVTS